jgi:hypothetical protein
MTDKPIPEVLRLISAAVLILSAGQACSSDLLSPSMAGLQGGTVGYTSRNPVIFDNDSVNESYFDEYFFALASQGVINLRAAITSSAWAEQGECGSGTVNADTSQRARAIAVARATGMRNIPDETAGAGMSLRKPSSGVIEDTRPVRANGAFRIRDEVLATSPDLPVVTVVGGMGTTVASAYLLAHESGRGQQFVERLIVAWSIGTPEGDGDYNGWVDPWAAHVVFGRLRVVAYPYDPNAFASVPKSELTKLPFDPLRQELINRGNPNGGPGDIEGDFMGAVPFTRDDYVQSYDMGSLVEGPIDCSADGCRRCSEVPRFVSGNGRAMRVTAVTPGVATEEWWRWMTDPATYGQPRPGAQGDVPGSVAPSMPLGNQLGGIVPPSPRVPGRP